MPKTLIYHRIEALRGRFSGLKGIFPLTSGEPQCTGVRALAAAKLQGPRIVRRAARFERVLKYPRPGVSDALDFTVANPGRR